MMGVQVFNVCVFLIYLYGLGHALTRNITALRGGEAVVMRIAFGLGAIPVLGTVLNLCHLPLDWRIFLGLSCLSPALNLKANLRNRRRPDPKIRLRKNAILLIIIFVLSAYMFCAGAFRYPWLEDDDPWSHAASIKYIATEKNLTVASGEFQYLNPYPPGYGILFAILHQTGPSLYWTLKFFNGLIVSLGILFFYFFVKAFTRDETRALYATFCLACIPCYLSHFIWAHALAVSLFFPALYGLLKAEDEPGFILPGSIVTAGIFLTQPTQSLKFLVFIVILFLVRALVTKRFNRRFLATAGIAVLLAALWWGPVVHTMISGTSCIATRGGTETLKTVSRTTDVIPALFDPTGGTATRSYQFKDFLLAPYPNYINNPIGIGPVLLLLALAGLAWTVTRTQRVEQHQRIAMITTIAWLVFTFLGVNSKTFHLPYGFFAFRFWMLLAIPVCILAAEAMTALSRGSLPPKVRLTIRTALIIGILAGSAYPKFNLNHDFWDWGRYWTSKEELKGYIWLRKHLPPDTKVFAYSDNQLVLGHDMFIDFWSEGYKRSLGDAFPLSASELYACFKKTGVEYFIIGARELRRYGTEEINAKIEAISASPYFEVVHSVPEGAVIFRVL